MIFLQLEPATAAKIVSRIVFGRHKRYEQSMIRASLAGMCYPAEKPELLRFVREWFDTPEGAPWVVNGTGPEPGNTFKGLVSPHIDFRVNTSVYAQAFAPWLVAPPADKVLVLGVGHRSHLEWSLDARGYETPLGKVATDKAGLGVLAKKVPKEFWSDAKAHAGEHSIEFSLICLQALRQLRGIREPFVFVPVLCGGLFQYIETARLPDAEAHLFRFAAALREWWQEAEAAGERVELVVSIDGCHMGPRFGHDYLVDEACLADCALWEENLWEIAATGDVTAFLRFLQQDRNQRYFDGVGALALVMAMFGKEAAGLIQRRGYAQWFEKRDGSAVTFSAASVAA